jgi:hypothetical protein
MTVNTTQIGLASPARLGPTGDWATVAGEDLLRADVGDLLGLTCATATEAGDLPWDGARGSQLATLRHRNVHPELTRALAEQIALGALGRDEPRVIPTRVEVEHDVRAQALRVHVSYLPRTAGERNVQTVTVGAS